jgi:ribosomal protein S18 acetylase RimI-like enzyme
VGRQLLEHAEGYAISEGAVALQVVVSRDDRRALDFYRGRGFVSAGEDLLELVLPRPG